MRAITLHAPWATLLVTLQPCAECADKRTVYYEAKGYGILCPSCHQIESAAPEGFTPVTATGADRGHQRGGLMVKRFETRSWPCPPSIIGQRVAFHQGKRLYDREVVERFADVLGSLWPILPLGCIVGSGVITASLPIVNEYPADGSNGVVLSVDPTRPLGSDLSLTLVSGDRINRVHTNISDQLPYGDWTPGRYAWLIEDAAPTTERCPWCWGASAVNTDVGYVACPVCEGTMRCDPIPAVGRQGWWNWEPAA